MPKLRLPLLANLVLALSLMGLLPLLISYFQLRSHEDALGEQVQRTHIIAATAAASRIDIYLGSLLRTASSYAAHPALAEPRSEGSQNLLRGTLQANQYIGVVALFNRAGEQVLLGRRRGLDDNIPSVLGQPDTDEPRHTLERLEAPLEKWLRVRTTLANELGYLVLIAEAQPLDEAIDAHELGDEAELLLSTRDLKLLAGSAEMKLDSYPQEVLDQARSGRVESSCKIYRGQESREDSVVAYAGLKQGPWFVLSRQPAQVAEVAQQRIRDATRKSALLALALTLVLALVAFFTVIRPLRRLVANQLALVGQGELQSGSEISQLESAFETLQQRIRDSEDLGQVFIGRYQITELVGSGAMGSVFRGWDEKLRRPVALKTVHIESEDIDHDRLMTNLRDEAAITARIHQPNIVTVYDIEEQGRSAFIAMEFVDGINLQDLLGSREFIDPDQVIPIGAGIARGLAAAHQAGLVHHDVKPANILLGFDGSVKLTDFGVSRMISAASKKREVICGTPGFLAPECFEGGEYTPSADLWAFGAVLYHCLVGNNPFRANTLAKTIARTLTYNADIRMARPGLHPELADLIDQLLDKEPQGRPKDAAVVAEALEKIQTELSLQWRPDFSAEVIAMRTKNRRRSDSTQLVPMTEADSH